VARHGSAGPLNGEVFNRLIAKIQGKSKLPTGKRIVVFSPHPDDDVISMGGILRKLTENGNEITVAYQTSGNIAVFDHEVRRFLDFVERARPTMSLAAHSELEARVRGIEAELNAKKVGEVDSQVVQDLKRIIRESEAVSAIESVGLTRDSARFLDLPFYQTGKVKKDPIGERDVEIVRALLDEIQPEIVFAAGVRPLRARKLRYDAVQPFRSRALAAAPDQAARLDTPGAPPHPWSGRRGFGEDASAVLPLFKEAAAAMDDRKAAAQMAEAYNEMFRGLAAQKAVLDHMQGGRDG
jgi:cell division septum initiation protein DivIVA